ncbi:F0F1 ATP synthase subunit B [Rhodobacter calidifons]|uniref:ATP synthase subunit b n=1 Tax=Rhodobacter calidifons TaxID=2715277 RepID=A0ABX0G9Y0_9RHOB|nr:F0F1 ATP synthase subunit B [Rhodobacter calidifons]NHB78085.1 F0F1 ATP synthase subunit B [Rhodobacter calidifons]
MKKLSILLTLLASPAMAASGPFFSLQNTNFVVLIAFIAFIGILIYMKVPAKITGMLDARAAAIKAELDEARALREEAKSILATYERRQKEVQEQADRIVSAARDEAMAAAAQAKEDLKAAIARRLAAANEQIASAEANAIRQVREQAVAVAVAAAGDVLSRQMTAEAASASIDEAIAEVEARLH